MTTVCKTHKQTTKKAVENSSGVNPAGGGQGDTSPSNFEWGGDGNASCPPNMAEISLHKRQRTRLYLLSYVIVLFLSNISCLQLCQMFYRGQLCELDFQILDHKQSRPPKFPIRFTSQENSNGYTWRCISHVVIHLKCTPKTTL